MEYRTCLCCCTAIIYIFSLEFNVLLRCFACRISKTSFTVSIIFYKIFISLLLLFFKMWIFILLQFCIIKSAWSHFNNENGSLPVASNSTNCTKSTCFYVAVEKCPPLNAKCPCVRFPECPQTAVCCNITSNQHLIKGLKCASKF